MPQPILAIGGATIDRTYLCAHEPSLGTSNPVSSRRGFGGVARNVAESLARLGADARLISAVGLDEAGGTLLASLATSGVDTRGMLVTSDHPTAEYIAAFWHGELFAGFADMGIFDALTPEAVASRLPENISEWLVFADCNLPAQTLAMLAARAESEGFRLSLDPVSLSKSERLPESLVAAAPLFLNAAQARHSGGIATLATRGAHTIVLTAGAQGVTVIDGADRRRLPAPKVAVVSVSGAGDALIAGTLLALAEDRPLAEAVRYGLAGAALALQTVATVPVDLDRARLETEIAKLPPIEGSANAV